jgi:FAD/FMN-containing dehydrogenase
MPEFKITDEGTREALESALWLHAHLEIWEDGLHADLYNAAESRARASVDAYKPADSVYETMEMLTVLCRQVATVRGAPMGTSVLIDVEEEDATFRRALDICQGLIEENESFWARPAEERARMLATRDAAIRLMAELPETSDTNPTEVTVTIPSEYLEDVRAALVAQIDNDSDSLQVNQAASAEKDTWCVEDRDASARCIREDLELLDQLLKASEKLEVTAPSGVLIGALEQMVWKLRDRLAGACVYGPVPMGDVVDVSTRLRWAADEAIRLCPALAHRLSDSEKKAVA